MWVTVDKIAFIFSSLSTVHIRDFQVFTVTLQFILHLLLTINYMLTV